MGLFRRSQPQPMPDSVPEGDLGAGLMPFFTQDHRHCDGEWARVEAAIERRDEALAMSSFTHFDALLRRHFDMEEEVLFPAFESTTGITMGPTQMMRIEHDRMRRVLDEMKTFADDGDWDEVSDLGDTLLMLTQQHNMKEENMLYPMSQQHLFHLWEGLSDRLRGYLAKG